MSISVIVPSYKNPKYLDLCLQSAIKGQTNKNEIIVVVDGFPELSKDVLKKYYDYVTVVEFEENQGMASAINHGVYNAMNSHVLVVSEDNVFPMGWDVILNTFETQYFVLSPNQIEPHGPSMYNFKIRDFGDTLEAFDLEKFYKEEPLLREEKYTDDGSTFPFMLKKETFMSVGGFDIAYESPFVVDWDFFLKLELLTGTHLRRLHQLNFYHFVSKSTKNRNGYIETATEKNDFFTGERKAFDYFEYKWGFPPHRDENNKCKQFLQF